MLAKSFSFMIIISFISAIFTGNFENMGREFATSLSDAVSLSISLLGMMCFWTGMMNVLRDSGVLKIISFAFRPLMKLVYGRKVLDGKTLENLSASLSANFLGLGNAAIPLGIKTVKEFERNNRSGVASDSTIMFAVLNTVPFQLVPSTLIALRTKYDSTNPFDVVPYIWLCSVLINVVAVVVCKMFSMSWRNKE